MRTLVTMVLGALMMILESSAAGVFELAVWVPHVAIGVIIYLALERDLVEASALTLVLAWMADLLGGAPPGLIGLSLTVVFLGVRLSAARFAYKRWLARAALAIVAAAAGQTVVMATLLLVGYDVALLAPFALAALPSCLLAPVGLVLAWLPMSKVDSLFARRSKQLLTT